MAGLIGRTHNEGRAGLINGGQGKQKGRGVTSADRGGVRPKIWRYEGC